MKRNRVFIIGNGFDLAHGLRTSYTDFLNWLVYEFCHVIYGSDFIDISMLTAFCNPIIAKVNPKNLIHNIYESISIHHRYYTQDDFLKDQRKNVSGIKELDFFPEKFKYFINTKSVLMYHLLSHSENPTWSHIEKIYYQVLLSTLNSVKDSDSGITSLNSAFEKITEEFCTYLSHADGDISIESFFTHHFFDLNVDNVPTLFLNFNYTSSVDRYLNFRSVDRNVYQHIQIHGHHRNKSNKIIFGYGDEMDGHYKKIEDLDDNEFLKHMKAFGYALNNNYENLLTFIDMAPFEVHIIGHSCGLSDRVMLNTIFEHERCEKIRIYYHIGKENFTLLNQNISRHFNKKARHREKVYGFDPAFPNSVVIER